ncbi:uncharacterized protein LOC123526190 [Mercenaria mercenaria]|uniref:uncharacterized protein LOC123526190 n=1 Tax=Mercenaria mercenaria TaxID=6596 RepID=UPI001E1D78AC|nr:uncharacterized protein LOC123526190 [Mercenaria mercenaria]
MNTATVCFIALWMFVASSEAKSSKDCPAVPCFLILYPPSCRSVSFFLHGKDQVCQGCDMCVVESTNLDKDGCPVKSCKSNKKAISEGCRRDIYYIYQGRKICQGCPQNICKN